MSLPPDGPPGGALHDAQQQPTFSLADIDSLLPGRSVAMPVIENFFRNQFEACLQQEGVTPNLESCLVFGPDTWADLRRLLLPGDGEAAAGKQGYPALERFCREHDAASKQYLLLPLLTPSHGSLLVVCRPEQQPAGGEGQPLLRHRYKMIKQLRAGICLPDEKPELLILHLDSLSGHGGLKGHQPDCTALNRFWQQQLSKKHKGKPCEVQVVVASVPQQGASGLGATFMCTSALYFVANLPPSLTSRQVELLKKYKENVKDLNEPSKHDAKDDSRWYPGFLTTEWYPLNVPEALRKLLLSGIVTGLKFEMPAQRLSKQLEMKRGRLLAAGRRYWGRVGWVGEGLSGIVMCSKGLWSILLRGNPRTTGLRFEDMQYPSGALPKPADFDLCFGVPLKQGQQPPPFVIHIPLRLLPQAAAAASTDLEERQLEMRFDSKPFISGHRTFWPLENSCWDALCSLLGTSLDECRKLRLVQRPGAGSKTGMVHVDLDLQLTQEARQAQQQQQQGPQPAAGQPPASQRSRGSQQTAGTGITPDVAAFVGGLGRLRDTAATPDMDRLQGGASSPRARSPTPDVDAAGGASSPHARSPTPDVDAAGGASSPHARSPTPDVDAAGGASSPHARSPTPDVDAVWRGGGGTPRPGGGTPDVLLPNAAGGGSPRPGGDTPDLALPDALPDAAGGEQHEAGTPDVDGDATPSMPGSPQHTAGTAGTADLADMAAASSLAALHRAGGTALQPTTKGAKRLQTGSDRRGDRRARLTVRGQKYYAGYFPTGAAAAQAEDLMVVWVHCSPTGWPEGWMQSCTGLDHKLNFPFSFHLATHKPLVASLSGCADKDALRKLLQKHLNSGGQQQPDDEELSQQPASQGGASASPRSQQPASAVAAGQEQQGAAGAGAKRPAPADSAAAGSSLGAKRQRAAAAGEHLARTRSLRSSASARGAEPQQGQQHEQLQGQQPGTAAGQSSAEGAVEQQAQQEQGPQQAQQGRQAQQQAQEQPAEPAPMEVDAAAPPAQQQGPAAGCGTEQHVAAARGSLPLPQHQSQQPAVQPKQEEEEQVLLSMHSWAAGQQPALKPKAAASAAGEPQPSLRSASSGLTVLRAMLQGSGGDSSWPADARQQVAEALAAADAASTESELVTAQVYAIVAALDPLAVPVSRRLACTRRFRQLPELQRAGLMAELRVIVAAGSTADLMDWMREVGTG